MAFTTYVAFNSILVTLFVPSSAPVFYLLVSLLAPIFVAGWQVQEPI